MEETRATRTPSHVESARGGAAASAAAGGAALAGLAGGGGAASRRGAARCEWCARPLPAQDGVGRRRKYCGQSCRQRSYEDRNALTRRELPTDSVVLSAAARDDLADRLYQMTCAAEDVATALGEGASRAELAELVDALIVASRAAERIR